MIMCVGKEASVLLIEEGSEFDPEGCIWFKVLLHVSHKRGHFYYCAINYLNLLFSSYSCFP